MAQTETRYTSRKKALALAAEAKQGFALLAREQEPDAAQWLAEAEQLIRELTARLPFRRLPPRRRVPRGCGPHAAGR